MVVNSSYDFEFGLAVASSSSSSSSPPHLLELRASFSFVFHFIMFSLYTSYLIFFFLRGFLSTYSWLSSRNFSLLKKEKKGEKGLEQRREIKSYKITKRTEKKEGGRGKDKKENDQRY